MTLNLSSQPPVKSVPVDVHAKHEIAASPCNFPTRSDAWILLTAFPVDKFHWQSKPFVSPVYNMPLVPTARPAMGAL